MPAIYVPGNYAFETYSELVAALNDWLDRADLDGVAGQLIALCEARLRRELAPLFLQASADVITVATGLGVLPADYGTLDRVIYGTRVLPNLGATTGPLMADASEPWAYTLEADGLRLWPAFAGTVTLLYQPTLPALSADTPSTDLLVKHPDLYFHGAMLFAEGYLANDRRAANFKALWDEGLAEAKQYLTRQKFAGPLVPKVAYIP